MTDLEKLYLNYLDMTAHLPGERMTLEEYVKARENFAGELAVSQILKEAQEG